MSRIIPQVYPISIIKADPDTGEPIRGKDGLCQKCKPNEPGVFIGEQVNANLLFINIESNCFSGKIIPNNPSRAFLGEK